MKVFRYEIHVVLHERDWAVEIVSNCIAPIKASGPAISKSDAGRHAMAQLTLLLGRYVAVLADTRPADKID